MTGRTLANTSELWPKPKYSPRRGVYFIGDGAYTESRDLADHVVLAVNAYLEAGRPTYQTPQASFCVEYVGLHGVWRINLSTWNAELDEDVWTSNSTTAYLIERAVRWEEQGITKETGEHRGRGDPVLLTNLEILRKHLDKLDRDDVSGE